MVGRQNGVSEDHSRSGIAHDSFDLFSHFLAITMNRATIAWRLVLFERAPLETSHDVSFQLFALPTQRGPGTTVLPSAKNANHFEDRPSFAFQASWVLHNENLYHI